MEQTRAIVITSLLTLYFPLLRLDKALGLLFVVWFVLFLTFKEKLFHSNQQKLSFVSKNPASRAQVGPLYSLWGTC